jgi:hypothetical protein
MIARPPKANTGAGYPAWWWFYGEPGIRGRHFYFFSTIIIRIYHFSPYQPGQLPWESKIRPAALLGAVHCSPGKNF